MFVYSFVEDLSLCFYIFDRLGKCEVQFLIIKTLSHLSYRKRYNLKMC